ncbi:MAG: cytochrome c biogenesis protein CcsA [Desulfobulbaceae bacterium]|nr:cytochrome c biogenesis protein CcsA [Desulfobulbaceae bacterium]
MDNHLVILTGLHWLAVIFYVAATIGNTWGIIFNKEKTEQISYRFIALGLLVHGAAILLWWHMVGHGPYMARYEVLSSISWMLLVIFLISCRYFPGLRPASILVFPSAFLMIALAVFFSPQTKTLPSTFRSIWLVLHVTFYKIALSTLVIALVFSIFYFLKRRASFHWLARLPELEQIDLFAYRFAGFGFVFWAIAMLAGSIWAYNSWGRFWGWDPIETWALITWAGFGIYLHIRRFFGWQGERAAWLFIICFLISLVSMFFVPLVDSTVHSEYFR